MQLIILVALLFLQAAKEAKVVSTLRHPHIVAFLDSFQDPERNAIVMEFCSGGDLQHFLKLRAASGAPLSEDEVMGCFVQLCLALEHIHAMVRPPF